MVNTSFMMGGAVGLAILASVAASRTESLTAAGDAADVALNGGYHAAFLVGAIFVLVGIGLGRRAAARRHGRGAGGARGARGRRGAGRGGRVGGGRGAGRR